jgi:hypothetical protein
MHVCDLRKKYALANVAAKHRDVWPSIFHTEPLVLNSTYGKQRPCTWLGEGRSSFKYHWTTILGSTFALVLSSPYSTILRHPTCASTIETDIRLGHTLPMALVTQRSIPNLAMACHGAAEMVSAVPIIPLDTTLDAPAVVT